MKADVKKLVFTYLDGLRDEARTNMYGAAPCLQRVFVLEKKEAREVLAEWLKKPSK